MFSFPTEMSRLGHLSQQIDFVAYLTTLPVLNEVDYCEAVDGMRAGKRNGSAWIKPCSCASSITNYGPDLRSNPCSCGEMPGINSCLSYGTDTQAG